MAKLVAVTILEPKNKKSTSAEPEQYGTTLALADAGRMLRLGRDPARADLAIPDDPMISGNPFHAFVQWDGKQVTVQRRDIVDSKLSKPNDIWFNAKAVEKCTVASGQWFVIGQTRFTFHQDETGSEASPIDGTLIQREVPHTRAQLEAIEFANPAAALRAMERIPTVLRAAADEQAMFRLMLKVVLDALPQSDAAGIVFIPPNAAPGGPLPLGILHHHARRTAVNDPNRFSPSRKLVHRAVGELQSRLHFWSTDPDSSPELASKSIGDMTLAALYNQDVTPWAICTPFQDGSKYALYLEGRLSGQRSASDQGVVRDLTEYQKLAEVIVGLLEVTRQTHKLTRQNALLRQALPRRMWKYLDDPVSQKNILEPRETDVVVLFCDLRNYSRHVEQQEESLHEAWKKVASALNMMSQAIALCDGVVARVQGDAVMGFWGWPDPIDDQLQNAVRAAIQIQREFGGRMQTMKCGVGLAYGRALAGRLGATDLAEVDLFGPVVNLAARLETMTKAFGVSVLVNKEVADRLVTLEGTGTDWQTRMLGRAIPKGMAATEVYELMSCDNRSSQPSVIGAWHQAVRLFTDGKWNDAYKLLDDYFSADAPAQCLMRVIDAARRTVPPKWDGSFVPIASPD